MKLPGDIYYSVFVDLVSFYLSVFLSVCLSLSLCLPHLVKNECVLVTLPEKEFTVISLDLLKRLKI